MYLYDKATTDFNNNGYGILRDALYASVTEVLNGEYSLSIEYPVGGILSEYLVEENIIKVDVGNGNLQLFRIKQADKTMTRIKVYAVHIFYDLADNFLEDVAPTEKNCQEALGWILARTNYTHPFNAFSDIATTASARYVRRNPVEAILGDPDNSLVKLYEAEVERDNFTVRLLSRRGADNHVKLHFGKNIKEINMSRVSTSLVTRVVPMGYDGLLLPEIYVDSPKIGDYPSPKIAKMEFPDVKVDPEDKEAFTTEEEAHAELRRLANLLFSVHHIDEPAISIKVDWVELSKVKEYYDRYSALETVHLGDTITAEILGMNYQTRCIKTVYNILKKRVDNFEIGTFQPSLITSTNRTIVELNKAIEAVPGEVLSAAQKNATSLITAALGGYVYKTQGELFIMDTDDPDTAQKVWRWNVAGLGYSSTGVNGTYEVAITNDGQIVADFITAGTLNVSKIAGLQDILNGLESSISLNGTNIQLAVTDISSIKTNGVGKLVNTLVTIDENGVNVSKTGQEMTSLLANNGLFVKRDSEVVLSATNLGVEAENVKVRKYLIIGNNSRMEDYQGGTGVFYIGT